MMNRWVLRGLVTAGFAGAAWAISSTAASADTPTTGPGHRVSLVASLDTDTPEGESRGITADLAVGGTASRTAAVSVTAGAAPVRTARRAPSATVDATVRIGRSTSDSAVTAGTDAGAVVDEAAAGIGSSAGVEATAGVGRSVWGEEPAAAAASAALVTGPVGTGDDPASDPGSGAGSGAADPDPEPGTDPEPDPHAGPGPDASPGTSPASLGVTGEPTAGTAPALSRTTPARTGGTAPAGGDALARTGANTAGLASLALLMMLAGAAIRRVGARH